MDIISVIIATAFPLLALFFMYRLDFYRTGNLSIYKLDFYKTGNFRFILSSFIWGGLAFLMARFLARILFSSWLSDLPWEIRQYTAIPILEEFLKAAFLIYLMRRPKLAYLVDGAIYGFAVGIGFSVFENYDYLLHISNAGLLTAIARVLSTNLMHATASALIGAVLGLTFFRRSFLNGIFLLVGALFAIIFHATFNYVIAGVSLSEGLVLLIVIISGVGGASFIVFAIKRGLNQKRVWIDEVLGMQDRVTSGEARLVNRIEDIDEILKPLEKQFGSEKIDTVKGFLALQAQIGMRRKSLDLFEGWNMRANVEREIDELKSEMEDAQQKVGSYVMLAVRNIFPGESSPLWGLMESRIQNRIDERRAVGGPKVNLFSSLEQRMSKIEKEKTKGEQ